MARLMDSIAVPQARASILWLLGEYSQLVSTIAPDVLRKVAKTYVTEVKINYCFKINFIYSNINLLSICVLCVCIGRHCEITNYEFSGQVVFNESRSDHFTVPVRA